MRYNSVYVTLFFQSFAVFGICMVVLFFVSSKFLPYVSIVVILTFSFL